MNLIIEIEQEEDGRWIAEIPKIPGAMIYGQTRQQAVAFVKSLALRILADRLEDQAQRKRLSSGAFKRRVG